MRLAVLISHPIQYYAPIFRALAERCDLHVFYGQQLTSSQQADSGFQEAFNWDVDLLSGYNSTTLHNVSSHPSPSRFGGCDTPEIWSRLSEGKFDALVVAGWYLKSHLQGIVAAKCMNVPVLVRGDSHLQMPSSSLKRSTKQIIYPILLKMFNAVLYVGKKSRDFYEHYRYPADRLFFSPHCVDNDWFAAGATEDSRVKLRQSLGIADDAFVILFAGKLLPFKRPTDLIAAAAKCRAAGRNVHVMVAGSGELEQQMRYGAVDAGVPLHMMGFCNQTQMPKAYAAADVLVLPSDGRETWGLVCNEALACGTPIVVSDMVGCAPDLAADGAAGRIFPVGNTIALANAIMATMDAQPPAGVLRRISKAYSIGAAVSGIEEALAALAAGRQHRF